MRTRALQLAGALRNVLLLVDAHRTGAQLKELISGGNAPPDALELLATMGVIEVTTAVAAAEAPPPAALPPGKSIIPPPKEMPLLEPEPAPAAPASARTADEDAASQRFNQLYTLMNELVSDYLGLRGYFMQLKIEKCSNAEELLALQGELGQALAKAPGKEVATELMARIAAASR